ncbi:calcium-binding protein [Microvirga calopogonii]|uniref:calcium-binding protein n=1 Tax=Microvirga calopogonii TaxID=2078013 RepID=UPI000E0CECEE|nr:calcium-binding protein [Microvirga calopogonii]
MGDASDQHTLNGTGNADLIFLERKGYSTPLLVNVTKIYGGEGNDLIDLTSDRFTYGGATLGGGNGDDTLLGNVGCDWLYGGAGADRLKGHSGNDYLSGEAGNDYLFGGRGNDKLNGGNGNDFLCGQLGKDVLLGGRGKDTFVFDVTPTKGNMDTITDFNVRDDTIQLVRSIYTKAGPKGWLKEYAFWTGSAAHDANDRIIYDSNSGNLYYDPDGTGGASQKYIAKLSPHLAVTHKDFFLV